MILFIVSTCYKLTALLFPVSKWTPSQNQSEGQISKWRSTHWLYGYLIIFSKSRSNYSSRESRTGILKLNWHEVTAVVSASWHQRLEISWLCWMTFYWLKIWVGCYFYNWNGVYGIIITLHYKYRSASRQVTLLSVSLTDANILKNLPYVPIKKSFSTGLDTLKKMII